jgi:branched-chain amino acid transport system substrate-binding protein
MLVGLSDGPEEGVPTTRRALLTAGLAPLATLPAATWPALAPRAAAAVTPGAATAEPLAFGALFPFSGSLSLLGDESFRGLDLAADERNAAGGLLGRPIRLLRGDASDPTQAAGETRRLLEQAKVSLLFGSYSSVVSFAASAITELAGVPYFELDALADPLTGRGFKLLFRSGPLASQCGALAVDTVADALVPAWRIAPPTLKLALLHEDGLAGVALADAQAQRCKERGLTLAERIAYVTTTMDFAPLVQRLRGAAADVVLHTGHAGDVMMFHRAMRQAGWRPRMVIGAGGGYSLNDTAQALGADFEGVLNADVTQYRVSDMAAPGAADVAAAYQRKYGAPPRSGHSLVCFAGARMFFDVVQRAGAFDHDRLRAAALATDLPAGASVGGWGVKFDDKGQNARAVPYLTQWQKGVLVTVAPKPAAVAPLVPTLGS